MSGPTHEQAAHFLPTAQPRRPSRLLLIASIVLLTLWAIVVALMAFHFL
jgi:hypothetical protein